MKDSVFKFEDFIKGKKEKLQSIQQILENVEDVEDVDIAEEPNYSLPDFTEIPEEEEEIQDIETEDLPQETEDEYTQEEDLIEEEDYDEEQYVEEVEEIENPIQQHPEKYYNLYSDKSENFTCDIAVQGADPKQTEARLVVESGDWTLMFYGEVKGGKCTIPIKKLNILKEGQVGDIRLEVIAEGNIFVPWEDKFKVRVSKKVTVKVNEQKDYYNRPARKNVGVKVKVKR